ncbi:MAG TPA: FAD-dependent oxidoreductase [Gaiellales bacterium]
MIGGGAIGAATAWAAARAGATVAVVDRGDIAGATSSASSKLLHGGLRYLAMGDIGLVREAHHERRVNARIVAPHLVWPLPFLVPVGPDAPVPLWKVRAGVWLYGALARFADGRSGRVPVAEARRRAPGLRHERLNGAVLYHDHQTNDGRLTLAALQGAAAHGAVVAPHVEALALRMAGGRVRGADLIDRLSGATLAVTAGSVVNAAGPWVDEVRRLESPQAGTTVRLSKGAHVLLDAPDGWSAAVTTPLPGGRVSFAIPWEGMLLLGTTDEPYEGDPAAVIAGEEDERQILEEAGRSLASEVVAPGRVRSRFAGLRVLPVAGGATATARRETVLHTGPGGMVSVAGGKLTTWRAIGARAATAALTGTGARIPRDPHQVPGAAPAEQVERRIAAEWPELEPDIRRSLARHYGLGALPALEPARERPELLGRIHPRGPDIWALVVHAAQREWAATPDDVLRGRLTVALRGHGTAEVTATVARMLEDI